MSRWMTLVPIVFGIGCAQHHCRRTPDPMPEVAGKAAAAEAPLTSGRRVKVYKYDGSLQCEQGKPVAIETMVKDLKNITVYSSIKKTDGLMHIQVCGSNTGMANVFEIAEDDLKKAESFGFKKWTFE